MVLSHLRASRSSLSSCSCTNSKPSRAMVSAKRSPVMPCSRKSRMAFSTTFSTSSLLVNTLSSAWPWATFLPQRPPTYTL